ncbi:CHASE2 domain-containing protein [Cystobacter fuscus]
MRSPLSRVHALRLRNRWRFILLVTALATAGAALCQRHGWLRIHDAELATYDQGLTFFTRGHARSRDVLIVGIDDRTLQGIRDNARYVRNYGVYPYSRNLWARVFEHLMDEGARAIVFDGVMDERGTDESNDLALVQVLEERGIPLTLGFSVNVGQPPLPRVEPVNRFPGLPPMRARRPRSPWPSWPRIPSPSRGSLHRSRPRTWRGRSRFPWIIPASCCPRWSRSRAAASPGFPSTPCHPCPCWCPPCRASDS